MKDKPEIIFLLCNVLFWLHLSESTYSPELVLSHGESGKTSEGLTSRLQRSKRSNQDLFNQIEGMLADRLEHITDEMKKFQTKLESRFDQVATIQLNTYLELREAETKLQAKLDTVRNQVENEIKSVVAKLDTVRNQTGNEVKEVLAKIEVANSEVQLRLAQLALAESTARMKTGEIGNELKVIRTKVEEIKSDVSWIKTPIETTRTDVYWIKNQWNPQNQKVEGHFQQMKEVQSTAGNKLSEVLNNLEAVRGKSSQIENKVDAVSSALTLASSQTVSTLTGLQVKLEELTKVDCGSPISGRITSPNYPNNYDNNTDLTWKIEAPICHKIRFTLEWITLENSTTCEYDFVQATALPSNQIIFKRCGLQVLPSNVTTTSNSVALRFKSDGSNEYKGFSLFYESYFQTPPVPVPRVKFYKNAGFVGDSLETSLTENICKSFPSDFSNVRSLDTGGRCIRLAHSQDCSGLGIRAYPGGNSANGDLIEISLDNTSFKSYSSCLFQLS